ncbi:hypothetical protein X777_14347 [Ooceraea biroi]|uniref:Uncharacterized protein n=1 Tax=Ooceraea biroi TaxID=2015173 RepID=A0A026WUQ1_OOCBI|nr:hypothetical protein X777_14347 [Ooceraea biroi]
MRFAYSSFNDFTRSLLRARPPLQLRSLRAPGASANANNLDIPCLTGPETSSGGINKIDL